MRTVDNWTNTIIVLHLVFLVAFSFSFSFFASIFRKDFYFFVTYRSFLSKLSVMYSVLIFMHLLFDTFSMGMSMECWIVFDPALVSFFCLLFYILSFFYKKNNIQFYGVLLTPLIVWVLHRFSYDIKIFLSMCMRWIP